MQSLFNISFQTISFFLILSIAVLSSEAIAQNGLSIFEDYGSGSSTTQSDDGNDNTALYVAGGLIIAGILVYALVINKDKKAPEDTTASTNSNLKLSYVNGTDYKDEIQKIKEKIPVDLFMGIRNNKAVVNDKTYLLGVRLKL